jgi:hypothetical protein
VPLFCFAQHEPEDGCGNAARSLRTWACDSRTGRDKSELASCAATRPRCEYFKEVRGRTWSSLSDFRHAAVFPLTDPIPKAVGVELLQLQGQGERSYLPGSTPTGLLMRPKVCFGEKSQSLQLASAARERMEREDALRAVPASSDVSPQECGVQCRSSPRALDSDPV